MGWPTVLWNASRAPELIQNGEQTAKKFVVDLKTPDSDLRLQLQSWLTTEVWLGLLLPHAISKPLRHLAAVATAQEVGPIDGAPLTEETAPHDILADAA